MFPGEHCPLPASYRGVQWHHTTVYHAGMHCEKVAARQYHESRAGALSSRLAASIYMTSVEAAVMVLLCTILNCDSFAN